MAGGACEEADALQTLSLSPEMYTLRKANTGCKRQPDNLYDSLRRSDGAVDKGTDPGARTPPIPAVCPQASHSASLCLSFSNWNWGQQYLPHCCEG